MIHLSRLCPLTSLCPRRLSGTSFPPSPVTASCKSGRDSLTYTLCHLGGLHYRKASGSELESRREQDHGRGRCKHANVVPCRPRGVILVPYGCVGRAAYPCICSQSVILWNVNDQGQQKLGQQQRQWRLPRVLLWPAQSCCGQRSRL